MDEDRKRIALERMASMSDAELEVALDTVKGPSLAFIKEEIARRAESRRNMDLATKSRGADAADRSASAAASSARTAKVSLMVAVLALATSAATLAGTWFKWW